ncbi:TPA: hypothetical protein ACH3X1_001371 [Trebouxia sp. C0004]
MQTLTSSRCAFSQGVVLRARAEPARRAAVSQCVVAKAPTKASDFRRLTLEEIDQQVQAAKRSLLLDFRVPQVKSQKKPKCQLKWDLETKVAQLLTVKRERELEGKISKRQSRSQQRSALVNAQYRPCFV